MGGEGGGGVCCCCCFCYSLTGSGNGVVMAVYCNSWSFLVLKLCEHLFYAINAYKDTGKQRCHDEFHGFFYTSLLCFKFILGEGCKAYLESFWR